MEGRKKLPALALLLLCAGAKGAYDTRVPQHGISTRLDHPGAHAFSGQLPISGRGIMPVLSAADGDVSEYLTPAPSSAHRPLPSVRTGGTRFNADGRDAGESNVAGAVSEWELVQLSAGAMSVHGKHDGVLSAGPFDVRAIFADTTSNAAMHACRSAGGGEAQVEYDRQAKRWLIMWQASPVLYCLALSASPDAAGRYFRYAISTNAPSGRRLHADDARMAVWPGAYLLSFSLFDGAQYRGPRMCTLARDAMLRGAEAPMRCRDAGPSAGPVSPAGYDGFSGAGRAGQALFVGLAADGAGRGNGIALWHWPVRGDMPSAPMPIETQPFLLSSQRIGQPTPGNSLAALADRLAPQVVVKQVDGREILVASHPLVLHDGRVGLRWLEIADPMGSPYIVQQGTLDAGSENRWMGSIGIDRRGNVALGYMVASLQSPAGVRYTGREPGDPPGMLQGEEVIVNGNGVITGMHGGGRASGKMALDPVDGCTFWYTQRYVPLTGSATWRARIASFRFLSCR